MAFIHLYARLSLIFVIPLFHLKTSQRFNLLFLRLEEFCLFQTEYEQLRWKNNPDPLNDSSTSSHQPGWTHLHVYHKFSVKHSWRKDKWHHQYIPGVVRGFRRAHRSSIDPIGVAVMEINRPARACVTLANHFFLLLVSRSRNPISMWNTTTCFPHMSHQYSWNHFAVGVMEPLQSALHLSSPPNPQDIPKHFMDVVELPSVFSGLKLPPK